VTDIFFSYRSVDRERVRPIRDSLAGQGFEVFWDQEVPTGADWDTWIRQHLGKSKCAVVFWSTASVTSDNVRHEATVAKLQGKLIAVLLEHLSPDQIPMGLYSQHAINLADWRGDLDDEGWRKLNRYIEARLTPPWVERKIFELEAELVAEQARGRGSENRIRALEAQIAKEVLAQGELKRERDNAINDAAPLKASIDALKRERSEIEERTALNAAETKQKVAARANPQLYKAESGMWERILSLGRPINLIAIGAALAIGFVTHLVMAPPQAPIVSTIQQSPTASATPAAPAASAPPSAVSTPQAAAQAPPTAVATRPLPLSNSGLFRIRSNTEAYGDSVGPYIYVGSIEECEQYCRKSTSCTTFSYFKLQRSCFVYETAKLRSSTFFDTGLRE